MSITYTWLIKHLSTDNRGYANIGYFELQGTDESGKSVKSAATVCFGDNDLKPLVQWTQENIDSYAETKRLGIEETIFEQLQEI